MSKFIGVQAFKFGYNEGLEAAAKHCEHIAKMAAAVREVDCSTEVVYALWRAEEIRGMKVTANPTGIFTANASANSSTITH